MKFQSVFSCALLLGFVACSPARLAFVPEISPPLRQQEVFAWTGQAAGNIMFPCAAGIGWVDAAGQIVTWDPEKNSAGTVYPLPFTVSASPFYQGEFLALRSQAGHQLLIFDLARMETRFVAADLPARQILAVDGEHVVYLDKENLVVCNWLKPDTSFRQAIGDQEFFNCHFLSDRILIMGRKQLFVFWVQSGKFQPLTLPQPAGGSFVYLDGSIYYGSSARQLVKYSLQRNKLTWKVTLGHDLKRQPLLQSGTVVVSPEDNSVLQLNRRGSVHWWLALDSILQQSLVPLADQLAAFLLNNEIKFIDIRRRLATRFKISGRPAGMALAYKNEVYFFVSDGKTQKLQRVGNRYGIDVEMEPRQVLLPLAPVTFSLRTSNLLRPRIQCVIRAESGQTLLEKNFAMSDRAQLVWLPPQAGIYRLQASAVAQNRSEEKEVVFLVFDPRCIILYFLGYF